MPQIQVFLADDSEFSLDLAEDKITVGRLADNALQIDDASVSSHHAELIHQDGSYLLRDLDSTNGTFVNDEPVAEILLKPGDEVRFGRISAIYKEEENSGVSHPLPETSGVVAETAKQSARPENFVSSSPISRRRKSRDVAAIVLYAVTVLVIAAWGASLYFVISLQNGS